MGYDTCLIDDACACTNRVGPDGTDYEAGDSVCLKAEGGPTCLTRPVLRERRSG